MTPAQISELAQHQETGATDSRPRATTAKPTAGAIARSGPRPCAALDESEHRRRNVPRDPSFHDQRKPGRASGLSEGAGELRAALLLPP